MMRKSKEIQRFEYDPHGSGSIFHSKRTRASTVEFVATVTPARKGSEGSDEIDTDYECNTNY